MQNLHKILKNVNCLTLRIHFNAAIFVFSSMFNCLYTFIPLRYFVLNLFLKNVGLKIYNSVLNFSLRGFVFASQMASVHCICQSLEMMTNRLSCISSFDFGVN